MIHLDADDLAMVKKILAFYLPGREVKVFGSRATGVRLKRYSDLDLCVMDGSALTVSELGTLMDAFDISDLPFRVDIVEWQALQEPFKGMIGKDLQDFE